MPGLRDRCPLVVPGPESPEWFSGHGPTGDILAGATAERGWNVFFAVKFLAGNA